MTTEKKFFVLGAAHTDLAWLLNLAPETLEKANRSIAWQRIGQGQFDPPGYWAIAEWDPTIPGFTVGGRHIYVGEGPYTERAWQEFMSSLPGVIVT